MAENRNALVSLVIPTYRREESLVACLKCALKQDYDPFEILVIDQTESHHVTTADYLDSIKDQVQIIRHSPPSAVTARNRGLLEAKGEIIIFIDDDTTFEPRFVVSHAVAHSRGADVVQGRVIEPGRGVSYRAQWMLPWLRVVGSNTFDKTSDTNTITGCNFSISRNAAKSVGEFDTNFTGVLIREDADYGARCKKAGLKIVFDADACLTHHRDSAGGVDAEIRAASRIFEPTYLRNELYFARKHFSAPIVWQYKWRLKKRIKREQARLGIGQDIDISGLLRDADSAALELLKN